MKKKVKILILKRKLSSLKADKKVFIKEVYRMRKTEEDETAEEMLPEFFAELDNKIEATSRLIERFEST